MNRSSYAPDVSTCSTSRAYHDNCTAADQGADPISAFAFDRTHHGGPYGSGTTVQYVRGHVCLVRQKGHLPRMNAAGRVSVEALVRAARKLDGIGDSEDSGDPGERALADWKRESKKARK